MVFDAFDDLLFNPSIEFRLEAVAKVDWESAWCVYEGHGIGFEVQAFLAFEQPMP